MAGSRSIRLLVAAKDPAFLFELVGKITSGRDMIIEASAHSWLGVVRAIRTARPDVSVLALELSGARLIKAIRRADPAARLILLVGPEDAGPRLQEMVDAGVAGVVGKDVPRRELLETIRTVFRGGSRLPRRVRRAPRPPTAPAGR